MMAKEVRWADRLFSPNITAQEFFSQSRQFGSLTFEKKAHKRAKRVEEIYNIRNKTFQEGQMVKIKTCASKQTIQKSEPMLSQTDTACNMVTQSAEDTALYLEESHRLSGIEEHFDHSFWKPNETAISQQEMSKHFKRESQNVEMLALNAEIAELKAKLVKTEEDLQKVQTELLEAEKIAPCYANYLEHIDMNAKKDLIIQSLQEELQDKSKTVNRLNQELYSARTEIQDLGLQNEQMRQQLNEFKQESELRSMTCIEMMKRQYNSHLKKLSNELKAVTEKMSSKNIQDDRILSAYDLHRKHLS